MKFKDVRQQVEWETGKLPRKITNIIKFIDHYCQAKYNYEITLTEVLRTQEEQDSIYKDDPNYKVKPWVSNHQYWRAVDLRTNDMKAGMVEDIAEVVNRITYDPKRPDKKTCVYHDVGKGIHFHLQQFGD